MLFLFTLISSFIISIFLIFKFTIFFLIQTLGLLFGMWGAFLLASDYTDEMFANTGYLGSKRVTDGLLKKQIPRRKIGIFLLIMGFLLQGIGQFIK